MAKKMKRDGPVSPKLARFDEFTELIKHLALRGNTRRAVIKTPADERRIYFVLEDLTKKIIRFRNEREETDLVKLALWAYRLWMKLYPGPHQEGG